MGASFFLMIYFTTLKILILFDTGSKNFVNAFYLNSYKEQEKI